MLTVLRGLISGAEDAATMLPDSQPKRIERTVRIENNGRPIELKLGKQTLRLYPETGVTGVPKNGKTDWLIVDPDRPATAVSGFARLEYGKTALIGRGNDDYDSIFGFPKSVAKRHLTLENVNGRILVRPLDNENTVYVSAADGPDEVQQRNERRLKNLRRVRRIFGGPIELLPPEEALENLEAAIQALNQEPHRQRDSEGRPGGLLELPRKLAPIIVGDLHAQIDNLLKILSEDSYLHALRRGEAYLLFLGDVVHRESDGELEEMDSSLLMLDLIFKLKRRFPKNVFHLRGNHESFDEDVGKLGVPQGLLLKKHAISLRGKDYAKRLSDYFEGLPYVATSGDFIACHAGPPRFKTSRKALIEIRDRPDLVREFTWNRVRRPNRLEGYSKRDVKALRACLGTEKHTALIVSHNCLSREGTIWTDVTEIKGHHIIYSARTDKLALFIRGQQDMVPLTYSHEVLLDLTNSLDC